MRLITKKLPPKDEPGSIKLVAEEGKGWAEIGWMICCHDLKYEPQAVFAALNTKTHSFASVTVFNISKCH